MRQRSTAGSRAPGPRTSGSLTAATWALATVALGAGTTLWAWRHLVVVTVEGHSMAPTFQDGDRVLVRRRGLADVRVGDIVVLEPPNTPDFLTAPPPVAGGTAQAPARPKTPGAAAQVWNVKRVAAVPGDPVPSGVPGEGGTVPSGRLAVLGDNPDSVDSRQRGLYPGDGLLGVVLRRLGRSAGPIGNAAADVSGDGPNRQQSPRSTLR
ncbi:S26 family signal peptidase [Actinomadura oligospora]|uniref:S26 family signal peptidase n=1 Tax=Actinomadura oligospora TaxID=111804 RepID=UPI0004AFF2D3|nr:S26 family signal peptidase [Actinomadura oligospora]